MTNNLIRGYPIGTPMSAFHQSWEVLKIRRYTDDWQPWDEHQEEVERQARMVADEHGDTTADEIRRLLTTLNPFIAPDNRAVEFGEHAPTSQGERRAARAQLKNHWTSNPEQSDFVSMKRNELVDQRAGDKPSYDPVKVAADDLNSLPKDAPKEKVDAAQQAYESAVHDYGRLTGAYNRKRAAIRREVQEVPVDAWLTEYQDTQKKEGAKAARAHKKEMTGLAEEQRKLSRKAGKDGLTEQEHERLQELMGHERLQDWMTNAPFHRLGAEHGDSEGELRAGKNVKSRADDARWARIEDERQKHIDAPMSVGGGGGYPQVTLNPNLAMGIAERSQPPVDLVGRKATSDSNFKPIIDRLAAQGADTEGAQRLVETILSEQRRAQEMAERNRAAAVAATQHRVATSSDQLSRGWWSILKSPAMTAAQWQGEGSGDGSFMPASAENTSGGGEPQTEDPDEKRRKAEMEHSLSTNNESTQQWFDSILPDALEFRSKLARAIWTPGVAIHDPNHSKNLKPMERAGQKIDEMIAHITSHKNDTPGKGRGRSGIPSIVSGEDDDSSTDPGFNSNWQDMNKGIINAFRKP